MSDIAETYAQNGTAIVNAVANTAGAAASTIEGASITISATAQTAANSAKAIEASTGLVADTLEHAKPSAKYLGSTFVHLSNITNKFAALVAAPMETSELALKAALTPVNRLLGTFTLAVNNGFDRIDRQLESIPQQKTSTLALAA